MKITKTTPDGTFTLTIRSVFSNPDEDVPDASLQQLVRVLEQTAQIFRVPPVPATPRVRIETVEALPGYRLGVGLSDGRTLERAFPELAAPIGSMDAPLQDPAYFAQVRLDPELQTAVWPNGYDICPDVLMWGVDTNDHLLAPPEPIDEPAVTAQGGACVKTQIAEECCYVRFGARPPAGVTSDMIGQTVRGERLIADFDAEGRIIGIELIGGPAKPCQAVSETDATQAKG